MKLSGTPNEKALIALSAYIIGFTTAYIFYFQLDDVSPSLAPVSSQQASVAQALTPETDASVAVISYTEQSAPNSTVVYYEDGRLLVDDGYNESPTLLSISRDRFGDDEIVLEYGVHSTRPSFVHYKDRDMVLFCESVDTSGNCNLFLYDVNTQVLQPLRDMNGDVAVYNTRLQLPVTYDELVSYTRATNLTF